MENIILGKVSVDKYKKGLPVYAVKISLDDSWKKVYQYKGEYQVTLGMGKDSNLYLYGSEQPSRSESSDILKVYINMDKLKENIADKKATIFIAPRLDQTVSTNVSKLTHDIYIQKDNDIKSIGHAKALLLQNGEKRESVLENRINSKKFDFIVCGGIDKDGSIYLNKDILVNFMDKQSQDDVTVNFKKYSGQESFYAYISDSANLNGKFDYKATFPKKLMEDNFRFKDLQALLINKPETRHDFIVVTGNEYLNSLNDFYIGKKKNLTFKDENILIRGYSKEAYKLDVTSSKIHVKDVERKNNQNNEQSSANFIPSVDSIKKTKQFKFNL